MSIMMTSDLLHRHHALLFPSNFFLFFTEKFDRKNLRLVREKIKIKKKENEKVLQNKRRLDCIAQRARLPRISSPFFLSSYSCFSHLSLHLTPNPCPTLTHPFCTPRSALLPRSSVMIIEKLFSTIMYISF